MKNKLGRPALITISAIIYMALFSSSIIMRDFADNSVVFDVAARKAIIYSVMAFGYIWAFLFFLTIHRLIFAIFLPIVFFLSAIASYFIREMGININERVVPAIFETNLNEASGFASVEMTVWILLCLAFGIIIGIVVPRIERKDKKDAQLLLIAGAFVLSSLLLDGGVSNQYLPYNYIKATGNYFINKNSGKNITDVSKYPAEMKDGENLAVVFVIGESARASNFHINGYERETTPLLEKENSLISFKDVTSCAAMTRDSVPCMLTRATSKNMEISAQETSFISIFKKLGFKTIWIDMQGATSSVFDSPIMQHVSEADKLITMNNDAILGVTRDQNALPYLQKIFSENPGKILVIIHSYGNHWPFDERYGEDFRKWQPVCGKTTPIIGQAALQSDMAACDRQALLNEYDNAILYTDWFLSEVINLIKSRDSFMLYSSDHGQSLGEDGVYLHGNMGRKEQRHVPMFLWFSDSFLAKNDEKYINAKSHQERELSHDYIFHSILDCAGVESEAVYKNLSLCR